MNTRIRYSILKKRYPDNIIVLAGDDWDAWKLRTYDDSAETLRWVNNAQYYRNAKGEPGLCISRPDLLKQYDLVEIARDAWIVLV